MMAAFRNIPWPILIGLLGWVRPHTCCTKVINAVNQIIFPHTFKEFNQSLQTTTLNPFVRRCLIEIPQVDSSIDLARLHLGG